MSRARISTMLFSAVLIGTDAPNVHAAETPVIARKVFFGNPDKAGAQISPDGKTLSFLAPVDGVMNVYVCPVGSDLASAKPVTKDKKRGVRDYHWAASSKHLLYMQDDDGDE